MIHDVILNSSKKYFVSVVSPVLAGSVKRILQAYMHLHMHGGVEQSTHTPADLAAACICTLMTRVISTMTGVHADLVTQSSTEWSWRCARGGSDCRSRSHIHSGARWRDAVVDKVLFPAQFFISSIAAVKFRLLCDSQSEGVWSMALKKNWTHLVNLVCFIVLWVSPDQVGPMSSFQRNFNFWSYSFPLVLHYFNPSLSWIKIRIMRLISIRWHPCLRKFGIREESIRALNHDVAELPPYLLGEGQRLCIIPNSCNTNL